MWYRARWYDGETGRFVSEDPISFSAGDTNLNRYVGNGPVNGTDPSGLKQSWFQWGVDGVKEYFRRFGIQAKAAGKVIHDAGVALGDTVGTHFGRIVYHGVDEEAKVLYESGKKTLNGLVQLGDFVISNPSQAGSMVLNGSVEFLDGITTDPNKSGQFLGHYVLAWEGIATGGYTGRVVRSLKKVKGAARYSKKVTKNADRINDVRRSVDKAKESAEAAVKKCDAPRVQREFSTTARISPKRLFVKHSAREENLPARLSTT